MWNYSRTVILNILMRGHSYPGINIPCSCLVYPTLKSLKAYEALPASLNSVKCHSPLFSKQEESITTLA